MVTSLDDLLTKLCSRPLTKDFVNSILQETHLRKEDFARYMLFNKACYMRNLIHRTDNFELLTICWEPGHQTPLHDHNGSFGWMLPIEGGLSENRYKLLQKPEPHFEKIGTFHTDTLTYIDDFIGMHVLLNDSGHRAVTLHLYSPPIRECRYYDLQTTATRTASMRYHSVDGVISA